MQLVHLKRAGKRRLRQLAGGILSAILIPALFLLLTAFPVPAQEREGPKRGYYAAVLASDRPGTSLTVDSGLVDPWGMVKGPSGPWWVAEEARGHITHYSGEGIPLPALSPFSLVLSPPPGGISDDATPTGIALNETDDFRIAPETPARLLMVTRDGAIMGWSGNYEDSPVLLVDNSPEAVYTGAAIGRYEGQNVLFVANLEQGRVEVYDSAFSYVLLKAGAFADPLIPFGCGPYNIQLLSGYVVVTYAKSDESERDAAPDPGSGYVDVFDSDGHLVLRLEHGEWLNAPWGIAAAPMEFGGYGGSLLIGNNGSGTIAAFDKGSGNFLGYLSDSAGTPLKIPGLHALSFGNNGLAGPSSTLYFSAGFYSPRQGTFGAVMSRASAYHLLLPGPLPAAPAY